MTFYKFAENDIINTRIVAYPSYTVSKNGDIVTGSIYLEKRFLDENLLNRQFEGYSDKEGGFVTTNGPFSSSIDFLDAEIDATNSELYRSILNLYDYYSLYSSDYTPNVTGSDTKRFRVITIPEIYYDRQILTGSLTASDFDIDGEPRNLYDNGRGGIYSGSLTGSIVGNIFYNEGLIVLKAGGLNDESISNDFGEASILNSKWSISFKGSHTIPVKIMRCRAPAGQCNASANSTYYQILTGSDNKYPNEKEIIMDKNSTYITAIGIYNSNYELVAIAKLAQPIRKTEASDLLFRLRLDF